MKPNTKSVVEVQKGRNFKINYFDKRKKKIKHETVMDTLQSTRDFRAAPFVRNSVSPRPCKSVNSSKNSESTKSDDKSLDKPRPPSANSSSAVKPPYSYIALSNYHSLKRAMYLCNKLIKIHFFHL